MQFARILSNYINDYLEIAIQLTAGVKTSADVLAIRSVNPFVVMLSANTVITP